MRISGKVGSFQALMLLAQSTWISRQQVTAG